MKHATRIFSLRRLALAAAIMAPVMSFAAGEAGTVLVATQGVKAIGADGAVRELARRSPVYAGDRLVTGSGARAQIKFTDGSIMGIKPNSEMRLDKYAYEPAGAQAMFMSLVKGGFRTVTGAIGKANKQDYKISTPVATIGIRGTLHEGDFNPDSGLALGVWDGGIDACNSGGCLDLGMNADYRFGFIGLDGRAEGRDTPPDGIGDDGEGHGDDRGREELGERGDDSDREDNDLADDNPGLFIDDHTHLLPPKYVGFAVLGTPYQPDTQYPWGTNAVLEIDDADANLVDAGTYQYVDGLWIKSADAGGYINSGFGGEGLYSQPQLNVTQDGSAKIIWGTWHGVSNGVSGDVSYGSFASGAVPGVETPVGVPARGLFAFGTWATPDVVASLTGQVQFTMTSGTEVLGLQIIDSMGYAQSPYGASAELMLDVDSGDVTGAIDFNNYYDGDWHLALSGRLHNQQLDLKVLRGVDGSSVGGGSYLLPLGGSAGSELAVDGTIDVDFVGSLDNIGILGAFEVATRDSTNTAASSGVFFLQQYVPMPDPTFTGFAALASPGAGTYPWGGSQPVLVLDDARLELDTGGNAIAGSLYSAAAGDQYIVPGCLDCQGTGVVFPTPPSYLNVPFDQTVKIAWGTWAGNDVSLNPVDDVNYTSSAIADPGVYIFGDWASPAVIAAMTGTVDFQLLAPFPLFTDAAAPAQAAEVGGGVMTLDVAAMTATGNMYFDTAGLDQWSISFGGTFVDQALSLAVLTDPVSPANASHFIAGGTGSPLAVEGSIQASFVGQSQVAGVVGAFDVITTDTADPNFARGVFGMTVVVPGT